MTPSPEASEKLGPIELTVHHIHLGKLGTSVSYCGLPLGETLTIPLPKDAMRERYCPTCWAYHCGRHGITLPRQEP